MTENPLSRQISRSFPPPLTIAVAEQAKAAMRSLTARVDLSRHSLITEEPLHPRRPEPIVLEIRSSGSEVDDLLVELLRRTLHVKSGNAEIRSDTSPSEP